MREKSGMPRVVFKTADNAESLEYSPFEIKGYRFIITNITFQRNYCK
jgi:hypothetical protein